MVFLDLLDFLMHLFKTILSGLRVFGLQSKYVHFFIEHFGCKPYIFSCFKLVASKHPDFDTGILEILNCFWDTILEFIL